MEWFYLTVLLVGPGLFASLCGYGAVKLPRMNHNFTHSLLLTAAFVLLSTAMFVAGICQFVIWVLMLSIGEGMGP